MKKMMLSGMIAVILAATLGCANRSVTTVMVPPRIDLKQHEMIGVVEFNTTAEGELGPLVTRKFTEAARRDQGLVRMIALGPERDALDSIGLHRLDSESFKALGQQHDLRTILVGELVLSDIRPNFRIAPNLRSGSITAEVDATLSVQMVEAETGASLWNGSARVRRTVGHVSLFGGRDFVFDAEDPERAYGDLVGTLVQQVTREFQVSWRRM